MDRVQEWLNGNYVQLTYGEVYDLIASGFSFDYVAEHGNEWIRENQQLIENLFVNGDFWGSMTLSKEMQLALASIDGINDHGYFEKLVELNPEVKEDMEIVVAAARNLNESAIHVLEDMRDNGKELPISEEELEKLDTMTRYDMTEQEYEEFLKEKLEEEILEDAHDLDEEYGDPYDDPLFNDEGVPLRVILFQQEHPEFVDADPEEIMYMLDHPEEYEIDDPDQAE